VGAKYVVLTTKHHDGFALWPTRVPHPRRKPEQRSARRDIVGELTRAVRAQGLRMGLYYSGGLDWSFVETPIVDSQDIRRAVPQMEEYARYADAQWRELIELYQPDILWNDITYPQKGDLLGILSEYYNRHPDGVVNNRFGVEFSDFTTPEYATYDKIRERKWESCRGLGFSFGYNQAEAPGHMLSADQLVDLLVDIVSKNGNLLLNIGPRADGSISELQLERLRALGGWLGVNGEAIYGTRPWVRPSSRTTEGVEVRFTRKGESIYAILLDKPKASTIVIESLYAAPNTTIELLSAPGSLPWSQKGKDLELTLPGQLPGAYAYVLRITPTPWQVVKE
jgi:alpha-L-fucosidase